MSVLPAEVELRGEVEVQLRAGDGKARQRGFRMVGYTGAEVQRWGRLIFDLAGIELPPKLPILLNHDANRPCALGTKLELTSEGLEISGRMASNEAAEYVAQLSDDFKNEGGFWQASVGLSVTAWEELYDETQVATVNGREVQGPCSIGRRSVLRECSFVPAGADKNTSAVALSAAKGAGMDVQKQIEEARAEGLRLAMVNLAKIQADFPGRESLAAQVFAEAGGDELKARALLAAKLFAELNAKPVVAPPVAAAPTEPPPAEAQLTAAMVQDLIAEGIAGAKQGLTQLRSQARDPGVGFDGQARQGGETDLSHLGDESSEERLEAEWQRLSADEKQHEFLGNKRAFFALARREGLHAALGV